MPTIQEYRKNYQEAHQSLGKAREEANKEIVSLGRIKHRPVGYQKKARKFYRGQVDVINTRESELNQEIGRVEVEVAQKNPYEALPEYIEPEYQRTKTIVQTEINNANEKISRIQKNKQEYQAWWDKQTSEYRDKNRDSYDSRIDDYENDIEQTQAYQRAFAETIGSSKEDVIHKVNTRYVFDLADYYQQREENSQERSAIQNKLLKQENITLIYKNNKWTGEVINTSELPAELQSKKINSQQISDYNSKVKKSQQEREIYLNQMKEKGFIPELDNKGNIVGFQDLNAGKTYSLDSVTSDKKIVSPVESNSTDMVTFGFSGITGKSVMPFASASSVKASEPIKADVYTEVQRYKDFGYSAEDAKILAKESINRGGMTFTPDYALQLVDTQKLKNQKFIDLVTGNGKKPEITTLQNELGQDVFSGASSNNPNVVYSGARDNSDKLWSASIRDYNNLGNNLVNQGFSRANNISDKETQIKDSDGSFFGRIRGKLKDWTGELEIPIFVGPGGGIKITDIKKTFSENSRETLSRYDVNDARDEVNLEWYKAVQNLDINPNTNEWIGSEEGYEAYQKKYGAYEKIDKEFSEKTTLQKIKADFTDWGSDFLEKWAPESPGELLLDTALIYGGVKAGGVVWGGASKVYSGLPTLVKTGLKLSGSAINTVGLFFSGKNVIDEELPWTTRTGNVALMGFGVVGVADDIGNAYGWTRSKYLPGSVKYVDDLSVDDAKALRDRATILVKDTKTGKYLVELDKNTGMYITPGGAVDKGEDFLKAAQRELFEETGLKVNPTDLKFTDDFITSRERYKVFTLDVDASTLNLAAQAKEVAAFKWVDAPLDYTGATTLKPFGQRTNPWKFWDKSVRSDDLYALSRADKVSDINREISALTKTQRSDLTNEARTWAESTFGAERIKGMSNNQLLKDYMLNQRQGLFQQLIINPAEEVFTRNNQEVYLNKRVKALKWNSPETWFDWGAGRKPGQFKKFQQYSGIEVGFGSRYDIPFEFLEEYSGKKMTYVHGSPGKIPTDLDITGEMQGWNIKNINFDETFEVVKKANQRGEGVLYFQPATKAEGGQAYLGASYLGILDDASSGKPVKLSWFKKNPNIYTANAIAGEDLIFTKKAMAGVEFEVGALPGTVFKVSGRGKNVWLAGRKVKNPYIDLMQNAPDEILRGWQNFGNMNSGQRTQFLNSVKKQTGIDYDQFFYNYVNPSDFFGGAGVINFSGMTNGSSRVRPPVKRGRGSSTPTFDEAMRGSAVQFAPEGYNPFTTYKEPPKPYKEPRKINNPYVWNGAYDFPIFEMPRIPVKPTNPTKPFNAGRKLSKKEWAMLYKRQYQYAPSMTAVILGLTEPIQNIKDPGFYSGFEFRGIPEIQDPFAMPQMQSKKRRRKRR